MRVVFMGTSEFSVATLEAMVQAGHQVAAVVTQPDKPKGRGKALAMSPVKEKAMALGIDVYQPVKARDESFIQVLGQIRPEAIVVAAFGQILPKAILDLPRHGCINVHASLLPKYRGASPIQHTVIDGEVETGITTIVMDQGIDTGDMLGQAKIKLDPKETGGSLQDKLKVLGGQLVVETLKKIELGTAVPIPQPEEGATYVKPLKKAMGDMDWSMEGAALERLVRGLSPWPSAYTRWKGRLLKIWEADLVEQEWEGAFGQVVEVGRDLLVVKTGKGGLSIRSLQIEGKKQMDVASFMRGYPMEKGTMLERRDG